jgi:hypothetical protein
MISGAFAKDLLDADAARIESRQEGLLTAAGRRVLHKVVKIMQPIPQHEIDAIIRGTLTDKSQSKT